MKKSLISQGRHESNFIPYTEEGRKLLGLGGCDSIIVVNCITQYSAKLLLYEIKNMPTSYKNNLSLQKLLRSKLSRLRPGCFI